MDDAERITIEDFDRQYRLSEAPYRRRVEQIVLGSDYGATSYTTLGQAVELAERLHLEPGRTLLDLGAGSGWPGLYLAAVTGCRVVLTDRPEESLRVAQKRAVEDGSADRCATVGPSGESLPFRNQAFDAITHTDVFC